MKHSSGTRLAFSFSFSFLMIATIVGCGASDSDKENLFDHEHVVPHHEPRSLWDLGKKIRNRIALLESTPDDAQAASELNDLVSWCAEIAADTNIGEERWMPIYELSEEIRESIEDNAQAWDASRREKAIRLCQLTDAAWRSLAPDQRVERFLLHDHEHDHTHSHGDNSHSHPQTGNDA